MGAQPRFFAHIQLFADIFSKNAIKDPDMRFDDDIFDFANFGKGQAPAEPEAAMVSDEGADAVDRA